VDRLSSSPHPNVRMVEEKKVEKELERQSREYQTKQEATT